MNQLEKILTESNNIVFFTGAGVSTESGISDFRSATGLFQKYPYRAETMLSHAYFMNHPESFFEFYKKEMIHEHALPNNLHKALTVLEQSGKLKAIITQNIDGLHQKAGSKHVLELHGSIYRNYCMDCNQFYSLEEFQKSHICKCGGMIKPDVVLYGEPLDNDMFENAIKNIEACDTFVIAGTSLSVYPANHLVSYFKGKNLIIINQTETKYDNRAAYVIHDRCGDALSFLLDKDKGTI